MYSSVCTSLCVCVLVTQFPTISLPPFLPLLSVCVLQSLFPLVPLSKHAVLSLVICLSSKRQGQRVLYKYFKLNSSVLSEFFLSALLSDIASLLLFPSSTLKQLQPNGQILWYFYLFQPVHKHTRQLISVHVNCSFPHIYLHKARHGCNQIIPTLYLFFPSSKRGGE